MYFSVVLFAILQTITNPACSVTHSLFIQSLEIHILIKIQQ